MTDTTTEIVKPEAAEIALPASNQLASYQPSQLLAMAIQKDLDISKLEKLMELQERWERNEAKKAFTRAMADFKKNPPKIIKDMKVEFGTQRGKTSYTHATLGNVASAVIEALSNHNLSHNWNINQSDPKNIKVTCTITHVAGYSENTSISAPADTSGSKNPIQAIGSTITYLQRYTLLSGCGLATNEFENDGRSHSSGNKNQAPKQQTNAGNNKPKSEPENGYAKFMVKAKMFGEWFNQNNYLETYKVVLKTTTDEASAQKVRNEKKQAEFLKAIRDKQVDLICENPDKFIDKIVKNDALWVAYYIRQVTLLKTENNQELVFKTIKDMTGDTESDPGKVTDTEIRTKFISEIESFKSTMM